MCDKDHLHESVRVHQETQVMYQSLFLVVKRVGSCQASRTARQRQSVVTGKLQPFVQHIIALLPESSVAAIHGGSTDAGGIESHCTPERVSLALHSGAPMCVGNGHASIPDYHKKGEAPLQSLAFLGF